MLTILLEISQIHLLRLRIAILHCCSHLYSLGSRTRRPGSSLLAGGLDRGIDVVGRPWYNIPVRASPVARMFAVPTSRGPPLLDLAFNLMTAVQNLENLVQPLDSHPAAFLVGSRAQLGSPRRHPLV